MDAKKTIQIIERQVQAELTRRKEENPHYSLRAFARDLGLNPAFLSQVMRGQARFSLERGMACLQKIGLDPRLLLDGTDHAPGSTESRNQAILLRMEAFQVIADWQHYAILELTHTRNFVTKPEWVASRLGISPETAKSSIDRLLRLGLLEKTPWGVKKTKNYIATPPEHASRFIRAYHKQMLEKAKTSLDDQSVAEREFGALTFAVHPKQIPALKEELRKFRKKIAKLMEGTSGADPTEVYQLNAHFFRLTQKEGNQS